MRTWNICKGLLEAGHEVHVVTVDDRVLPNSRIERNTEFTDAKVFPAYSESRIASFWPQIFVGQSQKGRTGQLSVIVGWLEKVFRKLTIWIGFDPMLLWAYSAWRLIRKRTDDDLVLVSGGPFSTFIPSVLLANRRKIPLVLDYRDVWNNSHHAKFRLSTRFLERLFLKQAKIVISVSPSCLGSVMDDIDRPQAVVTNGISDDVYEFRRHHSQSPKPFVVYAGAFYPPKRSIRPFFAALALCRQRMGGGLGFRFIYVGPSNEYVMTVAERYGVQKLVDCRGMVPHAEALKLQAQALCTLVVTTVGQYANGADKGVLTGKLFEAIDLARHVLVISPLDADARQLTAGIHHVQYFTGNQYIDMAEWLTELFTKMEAGANGVDSPRYFPWSVLREKYAKLIVCDESKVK